ncbi:MAG: hypothetical protein M1831_002681 [Alyxoria varia]|nr:MAG: hypothetical protein M1831_002681 [Alyxoria varia]
MKSAIAALSLLSSTTALVTHNTPCGGPGGPVGQLDDGQNRIGQSLHPATYCIEHGKLIDAHGRGCILTPPTTQWQCDVGASPDGGFAIGSDGALSHDGVEKFWSCPTGDHGGFNVYIQGVDKSTCVPINMHADKCYEMGHSPTEQPPKHPKPERPEHPAPQPEQPKPQHPKPEPKPEHPKPQPPQPEHHEPQHPKPQPPKPKQPKPQPPQPEHPEAEHPKAEHPKPEHPKPKQHPHPTPDHLVKQCPTDLHGPFEFPHLIVPVDSSKPGQEHGTRLNGQISPDVSCIFNFDIPREDEGKNCSLIFLFPKAEELETSFFNFSGSGEVDFASLKKPADSQTTYENKPDTAGPYHPKSLLPGTSVRIDDFTCPAGERIGYIMRSGNGHPPTKLEYFQDYNPAPIGLYITKC